MCNKKQINWPYQQLTMSEGYGVFLENFINYFQMQEKLKCQNSNLRHFRRSSLEDYLHVTFISWRLGSLRLHNFIYRKIPVIVPPFISPSNLKQIFQPGYKHPGYKPIYFYLFIYLFIFHSFHYVTGFL